jgi:AmiR/NasT family two-component response regulator
MSGRPPRASTRGDGKRAKSRGMTQGDRAERVDRGVDRGVERPERLAKPRAASLSPTDQFERISDDEVVEETEVPEVPQLRLLVIEGATHATTAQTAIVTAGHVARVSAAGRNGLDHVRAAAEDVDAVLVGLPGGEPMIDALLALGERRPVVIASSTASAVEAARRAAAVGADLATVRPHHVERLAPILLAAARLVDARRRLLAAVAPLDPDVLQGALDELSEPEPGGLQPREQFARAVEQEIDRAQRYGYPLTLAIFGLDLSPPPPPPGVRGILRARAGNALVHAIRDIDLATEIEQDRFLVLLPHTDRLVGAEIARRIISAVGAGDPVIAGGRSFAPKVIGAVAGAGPGEPLAFSQLLHDATQLLEQAQVTGASLAVES